MIPPVTSRRPPVLKSQEPKITPERLLPTVENLKKIGFIDDHYNLLFTPSHIPPIKQSRWDALMKTKIGEISLEEYITGFSKSLAEKGIKIDSYLRGGYAAYVACIPEYFNCLLEEFLASKNLPAFAKFETDVPLPHDIDLFDHVLNGGIPPTALDLYYQEFLKKNALQFTKKLIPKTSLVFPYPEDYVLFVVEGVDRIIGRLNHPYLFTRDDIRIKYGELVPESAVNFWQMVVERSLKIVRLEPWHEKDFRAGLAALQLMQEGHILIQDACPIERIFRYAVSTGSDKIYSGATDRAKLHCKNPMGFLISAHIAYAHAGGHVPIEDPPLPSLYKLALFSVCYKTSYKAYFESGLLVLHWKDHKIIFPKGFSVTSKENPFYETDDWVLQSQTDPAILDGDLAPLERVLFELTFQKPYTPLSESMKNALVDYLIEDNTVELRGRISHWLTPGKGLLGWTKAFLNYSIKHGLRLWNALKQEEKFAGIEGIVNQPVYSYSLLGDAPISKTLRLNHLKTILKTSALKPDLAEKIFEELMEENSLPSAEQIEAYYLVTKNVQNLIRWLSLNPEGAPIVLQKNKDVIKPQSETYIRLIKFFRLEALAKEWIHAFPFEKKMQQSLLFFADSDLLFLDSICSLPGLKEKDLLSALYMQGKTVFKGRPAGKLLELLNLDFSPEIKEEIFKTLVQTPCDKKELAPLQRSMTLQYVPHCLENPELIPIAVTYLVGLKTTKNVEPLWSKTVDAAFKYPATLHALTPFFRNRRWVRSVYGAEAKSKAEKWGKETDSSEILSLYKLKFSPLVNLRMALEGICGQRLMRDDMIEPCFRGLISTLLKSMHINDEKIYSLDRLCHLTKLALEADICSLDDLNDLIDLSCLPIISCEEFTYDPFFSLIQNLTFSTFGSSKLYDEWVAKKTELHNKWVNLPTVDDFAFIVKKIKQSYVMKVIPYELAQASFEYSYRFKLITEQYIENRVGKEEFQEEVRSLSHLDNEDPRLICIQSLAFLLKDAQKRERAYEAFYYLLQGQMKSTLAQEMLKYLEVRQKTEELILNRSKLLENGKITYSAYLGIVLTRIVELTESNRPNCLEIPDPISDAFDLLSIDVLERFDLQRIWLKVLAESNSMYYTIQFQKIKGRMLYDKKLIIEKDSEAYLQKRARMLQKIKDILTIEAKIMEIDIITEAASRYLSEEKQVSLVQYMQKILGITVKMHKK